MTYDGISLLLHNRVAIDAPVCSVDFGRKIEASVADDMRWKIALATRQSREWHGLRSRVVAKDTTKSRPTHLSAKGICVDISATRICIKQIDFK